jgi:hypothetical protein
MLHAMVQGMHAVKHIAAVYVLTLATSHVPTHPLIPVPTGWNELYSNRPWNQIGHLAVESNLSFRNAYAATKRK